MALGTKASRRMRKALVYTFLSAILVVWLLPVFSLVTTSLKNLKQIYAFPAVRFCPSQSTSGTRPSSPRW